MASRPTWHDEVPAIDGPDDADPMDFDIPTAMQLAATMTLVIGGGLAFAATGYPPALQRALDLWVRGLLLQPPAYLMFALRGHIPDLWSIVVANTLLMAAFAHEVHALRVFNGCSDRRRLLALLVIATLVGTSLLTWAWPSLGGRTVLVSLVSLVMCLLGILGIHGARGPRSRPEHLVVLFLGAGILIMLARIVAQPTSSALSIVSYSPLQGIVFTYASLLPVIATAAFMLMCGDRLNADLARLANLDPLTGVYNRRTLDELGRRAVADARRAQRPLAVLILDIDHFKQINDDFGHDAGDTALKTLVERLRRELREGDIISRVGGEEFVIVLPGVDEDGAEILAERIRDRVGASSFGVDGVGIPLRVSIGAGALGPHAADFDALRQATDRALYAAKRSGRNRVARVSSLAATEPPAAP